MVVDTHPEHVVYIYTYMCIYICISREYPRDGGMEEGEGGVQGPAALETG